MKQWNLTYIDRAAVGPADPDYAHCGYGDYPRITTRIVATCEAETERQAQGVFKRTVNANVRFNKNSPVCRWHIEPATGGDA